jgi:integrase
VRNSLVLTCEIRAAIDHMKHLRSVAEPTKNLRALQQTYIAFILLAATGCRIGEVAGLQFRDVKIRTDTVELRVRINLFRGTKTTAAARIVSFQVTEQEKELLEGFLRGEQRRLGRTHFRRTRLTFLTLSSSRRGLPLGSAVLRSYLTPILRGVSGRPLISYDIRHLHGTRLQAEMALGGGATPAPSGSTPMIDFPKRASRDLYLPRHTHARSMQMGHASPETTNHSYGGLPWLYLVGQGQDSLRYLNSRAIASLFGIKEASARRELVRHGDEIGTWALNRLAPADKKQRKKRAPAPPKVQPVLRTKGVPPIIDFLSEAHAHGGADTYPAYGLTEEVYRAIHSAAAEIYAETGLALFPDLPGANPKENRLDKPPTWSKGSRRLRELAQSLDDPDADIWEIASSFRAIRVRGQSQKKLLLPEKEGMQLVQQIENLRGDFGIRSLKQGRKIEIEVLRDGQNVTKHVSWLLASIEAIRSGSGLPVA